jgi:hypothetical protein
MFAATERCATAPRAIAHFRLDHREPHVSYDAWEQSVPPPIREDPLWTLRIYRLALYAGELGQRDAAYLARRAGCAGIAPQLARVTGAISAHIAGGYSRGASRVQALCYEQALAAARESRDWYFKVRGELGPGAGDARLSLLATIIKVLIALVTRARERSQARRAVG